MTNFKGPQLAASLDTTRFLTLIDYVTDYSNFDFVQGLSVKVYSNKIVVTYRKDGVCKSHTADLNKEQVIDFIEVYNKKKELKAYQQLTLVSLKGGVMLLEDTVKVAISCKVDLDADPVRLAEATSLYSKVVGTSAHSVYRCFFRSERVNGACRWKGATLSLRFEGDMTPDEKQRIADLGFAVSSNKHGDYLSTHLSLAKKPEVLRAKTIGSIAMSVAAIFGPSSEVALDVDKLLEGTE